MMKVKNLWFDPERMYIETTHKKVLSVALNRFPRLERADTRQRETWQQVYDGLRWDEIDEDISLESFTLNDNDPHILSYRD
ncbi:MAG: DUF2442 domain-containing protein [Tannerella sp.]|jgi:hypothetical protein|nr:DUF2442 domain-containing protein [Tannerella sp.]